MLTNVISSLLLAIVLLSSYSFAQTAPSQSNPCNQGNLSEETPATRAAIEDFFTRLQSGIRQHDRKALSMLVAYPLLVSNGKTKFHVKNPKDFETKFRLIFTPGLQRFILESKAECISRVGAQGFSVGLGELWFDEYHDGKIKLFSVNNRIVHLDQPVRP